MPTLKELQAAQVVLQQRVSVWESIADFLDSNFLSKDGQVAPKAIRAPGCIVDRVPEEQIEYVLQTIMEGPLAEIRGELEKLESQELNPSTKKSKGD